MTDKMYPKTTVATDTEGYYVDSSEGIESQIRAEAFKEVGEWLAGKTHHPEVWISKFEPFLNKSDRYTVDVRSDEIQSLKEGKKP